LAEFDTYKAAYALAIARMLFESEGYLPPGHHRTSARCLTEEVISHLERILEEAIDEDTAPCRT